MWARDPWSAQDMSTYHNLCSPESENHASHYDGARLRWVAKKNLRPFLLENSGEDRPKIFIPSSKIRHEQCALHTFDIATASVFPHNERVSFLLRNSFQYKTAIKLGRDLLEKEGCSRKEMVFDSLKDAPSLQVRQRPKSQQSSHQPCVILWHLIFKYSHLTKPQRSYKMSHLFIVVVYDSFNRKKRQNFQNL